MKNVKLILLCLSLLVFAGCGGGGAGCDSAAPSNSGTVSGIIADSNLLPISGASISVGNVTTVSGSDGRYTLTGVPTGMQTLSISALNYISTAKQINVLVFETTFLPMIVLSKTDSKSTDIGPAGGQIENTDGSIKISIPPNALKSSYTFVINKCDISSAPKNPPANYKFIFLAYITPSDIDLLTPAALTFSLPSQLAAGSLVTFFRYDPNGFSWDLAGSANVSANNTVSLNISKFGWVAAAVLLNSNYGSVTGRVVGSLGTVISGANVISSSHLETTDTSGYYSLTNMDLGAAVITASSSGYNSNNVLLTIVQGTNTASDIVLTPTSSIYGSITGSVKDADGLSPISGARVIAGGKETLSDSSGNFLLTEISPGTVTVSVFANGYLKKSSDTAVTGGKSSAIDFLIQKTAVSSFTDDFETDKGWTVGSSYQFSPRSLWHRVNNSTSIKDTLAPAYVTLPDYDVNQGAIPLAHGGNYSYWFGEDVNGSYIGDQQTTPPDTLLSGGFSSSRFQGELTSPKISLNGYAYAALSFWAWWEIESMHGSTGFDVMSVKVSKDAGVTWVDLGSLTPTFDPLGKAPNNPYSSGGFNNPGVWVKHQFNLTPYVGEDVLIRFSFDTKDNKFNGFRGWFIDDVAIN